MRYLVITCIALLISPLAPITAVVILISLLAAHNSGWGLNASKRL